MASGNPCYNRSLFDPQGATQHRSQYAGTQSSPWQEQDHPDDDRSCLQSCLPARSRYALPAGITEKYTKPIPSGKCIWRFARAVPRVVRAISNRGDLRLNPGLLFAITSTTSRCLMTLFEWNRTSDTTGILSVATSLTTATGYLVAQ